MRLATPLVCVAALFAATPAAWAHHTPTPGTVALVGSLQSELGCPGDWQPECAATRLQPVAGSPGVYRGTFTPPAGTYEYKVALNNSWDENYGAGGAAGGANIPITAAGGPVTFTYDHQTHVIADDVPRPLQAVRGAHWLRSGIGTEADIHSRLRNAAKILHRDGKILTPYFSSYLLPTILDMPTQIVPVIMELADPNGPYGARGMAEMALVPLAPAIAAAIHDATGAWLAQQPMTPERVLAAVERVTSDE